jgi:NAD(P)-dependent dehydrogenase (short-subunit alcohol dehydrogenase family)
VSDPQAVRGMFDAAEAAFGGVDVLVNNAGIMVLSTIVDTDDVTIERQINVNLRGTDHVDLACLDIGDQPFQGGPLRRAAGKPAIIIERRQHRPALVLL